jgi:hypothetical protein
VENHGGKRSLGRPRRRRDGNIKTDLEEIGWEDMEQIDLAQYRDERRAVFNGAMKLAVPERWGTC